MLLILSIAILLVGCTGSFDVPFVPELSGRIVNINKLGELNVIEVSTMKSVAYGDASTNSRPVWSYDGAKFAAFEEIPRPY